MTRTDIEKTIYKALVDEFELDPKILIPGARVKDDIGLDSLDIVDLVIVLETAFGFKIRDKSALLKIQTLGDIVAFIEATAANLQNEKTGTTD